MMNREILLEHCTTDVQRENVNAYFDNGESYREAGRAIGKGHSSIINTIKRVEKVAVSKGVDPDKDLTHEVGAGNIIKRVSTNYDGDGNIKQQWVIQEPEKQAQLEMMSSAVEQLLEPLKPLPVIDFVNKKTTADILNLYTLTDVHLAMLAWDKEGGDDWDLDIATRTVKGTFIEMLNKSPDSDECLINQGGDWQQYDSFKPVTPTHGHILDSDSRPQKMVKVSIELMRWLITEALKKHKRVNVVIQIGNHDQFSALFLQQAMIAIFSDNPRVVIDDSPLPYYAFEFGAVMLAFHHGHIRKNEQLPLLFATLFPEMWGRAKIRDVHKGHRHHFEIKEMSGMTIIEHPTIAARESHASHGGFFSTRCAIGVVYHKKGKRVGLTFSEPDMIN